MCARGRMKEAERQRKGERERERFPVLQKISRKMENDLELKHGYMMDKFDSIH